MKICCIADVHIDDYRYFNPSQEDYERLELTGDIDDYRLKQCLTFAHALVTYGQRQGIENLFMLGDTINKPRSSPRVVHTCGEFIRTLNQQFHVYYILGQHDMDAKIETLDVKDTFMSLFDGPRTTYMHGQYLELGGRKFLFKNWQPFDEVEFPDCDVALGHVSLGLCQRPLGNYKLGVFGDIHTPVQFNHLLGDNVTGVDYSVSPPYQLYPSQPDTGYFGIINTDDLTYVRVESDTLL